MAFWIGARAAFGTLASGISSSTLITFPDASKETSRLCPFTFSSASYSVLPFSDSFVKTADGRTLALLLDCALNGRREIAHSDFHLGCNGGRAGQQDGGGHSGAN